MLGTLSAKHDLALAALDVESEVTEVELKSGMEELKRRLEQLLGEKPAAPIDISARDETEAEACEQTEQRAAAASQAESREASAVSSASVSSSNSSTSVSSTSSLGGAASPGTLPPMSARQEKVAAAGGEMLGAVLISSAN